jgi:hypothetical protein
MAATYRGTILMPVTRSRLARALRGPIGWLIGRRPDGRPAELAIRVTPACIPTNCRRRRSLGLSCERTGHPGAGPGGTAALARY